MHNFAVSIALASTSPLLPVHAYADQGLPLIETPATNCFVDTHQTLHRQSPLLTSKAKLASSAERKFKGIDSCRRRFQRGTTWEGILQSRQPCGWHRTWHAPRYVHPISVAQILSLVVVFGSLFYKSASADLQRCVLRVCASEEQTLASCYNRVLAVHSPRASSANLKKRTLMNMLHGQPSLKLYHVQSRFGCLILVQVLHEAVTLKCQCANQTLQKAGETWRGSSPRPKLKRSIPK